MEFMYRAGDKRRLRGRSPSLSPPTLLATIAPGGGGASAAGDDEIVRPAYPNRGGSQSSPPCRLVPPSGRPDGWSARDPNDLQVSAADDVDDEDCCRQLEKARIRDRILREETLDRFELELEVRLDLVERFRQMALPREGGVEQVAAPTANTSSPVAPKANSEAYAPAPSSLAKRERPVHGAGSTASEDTINKKQKLSSLTCMVCGITANSENSMHDHLKGKNHKRKAAALAAQPTTKPEPDDKGEVEEEDASVVTPAPERSDNNDFKATKFTMLTDAGTLNQVTEMNGYLLCELCNVRTTDRVTMMCHFQGCKHIAKAKKAHEMAAGSCDLETSVVLEVDCERHTVRRQGGSLLCKFCDVRTPTETGMRTHLSRKKHKHKVKSSYFASTNSGKEAAKAQAIGTPVVDETFPQMEAPLENPMEEKAGDGITEGKGNMATLAEKDMVAVESSKATSPVAANGLGHSVVDMEVDGMRHPVQRVDDMLLCPCCDVKATSEIVMRSHLTGKKHMNKMTSSTTPTAEEAGSEVPMATKANTAASANNVAAVAQPMELHAQTHQQPEAVIAATEPGADDATTERTGNWKPTTFYVEGEMFTVLWGEDGRLLCEPCGITCLNKDAMIKHMYTRMHWEKAYVADKDQLPAALPKDGVGGNATGEAKGSGEELINCNSRG